MRELLFDGKHDVNTDEVLEKMNYFITTARKGMELYKKDPKLVLKLLKK